MNLRLLAKQRLLLLCIVVVIITAAYLKLHYTEDNSEGTKLSSERCFTELTSTKYQLNVVTEYKNRIDKLLTEMEKKHRVEKEQFGEVMDSCVAMKQQSLLCQVALSSFYEHGGNVEEAANPPPMALPQLSDSEAESPPQSPVLPQSPVQPQKKDRKKPTNPHFATLDSLQQESSSDEEGEAFYAGGSERSGQQILGPGKGRKDIVTEMFKSVRERGAVVFDEEPSSTSRGRGGVFSGVGYRLGQTPDDHEQVTPSPGRTAGQQENQPRSVRLQLYREGFSVDGGPLRQYSDPDNADFLSCIRGGEIPSELSGSGEVRLSLEDRRHEDCPRAASRHQAFSGKGQLLGSPTPATVGATVAVAASTDDRAANQRAAQEAVNLDESSPVTTVQFRLADGSRLTGRFNHTHTVADLIQYVSRAEPAYQLQPFALLTSFPSSELADRGATLAQANLLNSTLLQRLK